MGQLERYGLYVLAIVVMLIVGVAVFGEDSTSDGMFAKEKPWDQSATADPFVRDDDSPGFGSFADPRGGASLQRNRSSGSTGSIGDFISGDDDQDSIGDFFSPREAKTADPRMRGETALEDLGNGRFDGSGEDDSPEFRERTGERRDSEIGGGAPSQDLVDDPRPDDPAGETAGVRYRISSGDTFERIARRYYPGQNAPQVGRAIAAANPNVKSTQMLPGAEIVLPVYQGTAPSLSTGTGSGSTDGRNVGSGPGTYRVKRGDTLTAIAQLHWGTRSQAAIRALQEANRNVDPRRLQVGQVLTIPDFQRR